MHICLKQLSYENIMSSSEIQAWLSQFEAEDKDTLCNMLMHLQFISKDTFSEWLTKKIKQLVKEESIALYCIRDIKEDFFWDKDGKLVSRPADFLGSEDFVYSIVGSIAKTCKNCYEHVDIKILKKNKIKKFVFIDDSIGSGQKVSKFLKKIFSNKTFLSWWNYNLIKIYIISFARTKKSEELIIKNLPGIEHRSRKFKKSDKIEFRSHIVYRNEDLKKRWGENYIKIKNICEKQNDIKNKYGYGETMSNLVFYHSIPNNIPGILFKSINQKSLFEKSRVFPEWLESLLENSGVTEKISDKKLMKEMIENIKRGVRRKASIALSMDCDITIVNSLINQAIFFNLINQNLYITEAGMNFLHQNQIYDKREYNKSLYIPKKWSINQTSTQPFMDVSHSQTDSDEPICVLSDGDPGLGSLERTDAMTAMPSSIIEPTIPSMSRARFDDTGHKD